MQDVEKRVFEELLEYSPKIIAGTKQVIDELRVAKKKDTEELFNLVVQGINWEIEVFNTCEPLINSKGKKIDKSKMAKAVVRLGKVLQDKDDIKIAACLDVDFMSFLKSMELAAKDICQK